MQQFFPATRPLFFYLFVFTLRIKSIGELIFLCFAFLFYHSRACLHDIGWRHVHRFYYLRCFYYLCWFYYNRSIVTAGNYVYATKPIFFRKKCSSVDHLSQERRKLLTSGFFNEILNDFSSDRSWFLRNQWHSFSIKRVYFSTFIFQQKYLDISSFLKRHFRTFSSGTGEPFKVLGWNIDRSLEKSILSLWMYFLLAYLKQFFLKMVHT